MNPWVLPGAVLLATGLAVAGAGLMPVAPVPEQQATAAAARVSLVCPGFASVTANVRVFAATTGTGLRVHELGESDTEAGVAQSRLIPDATAPLRVSAVLPDPFGASSYVATASGPARGVSATGCVSPRTEHWFAGVDVRAEAQADLTVVNLDPTAASVEVAAFGRDGRIAAPRGVEVAGGSSQAISLSGLPRGEDPVTIEVSSSDGRFAAFLRQRSWTGETSLGGDWLAAGVAPATEVVIPGLAAGAGLRRLVVTNPGERTATVGVKFLGEAGSGVAAGAGDLEVPPQTTRTLELEAGLAGQAVALQLSATQPVTAAVWQDTAAAAATHDPAFAVAAPPLPPDSLWPLAAGKRAVAVLALANPGAQPAAVTLTLGATAQGGQPQQVTVPAGGQVQLPLPAGSTTTARIQVQGDQLRGAIVVTRKIGKVQGLAVWPLVDQDSGGEPTPVTYEPGLGSR